MALPTIPVVASTRVKHSSNSSIPSSSSPYPPPAPSSNANNTNPANRPYSPSASSSASSGGNGFLNAHLNTSSGYAPVPTGQSASRLNPNWSAPSPTRTESKTGSGSSGSREGSDEIEMDEAPARSSAALDVPIVSGRGEVVDGVVTSRLGTAYGPYSYQSMSQHPSQAPFLAAPLAGPGQVPPHPRYSAMSGLSSSPSNLSSYTAGAGSTVPFNDYPSSDNQSETEKRYSMVPSLMGLGVGQNRPSSVLQPTAGMYMWDEKDPDMDDALHRPDPPGTKDTSFAGWSWRGFINLTAIAVLLACLLLLFLGYPILTEMRNQNAKGPAGSFNLGGVNGTGQVPNIPNLPSLIDPDTPSDVYSRTGFDGKAYNLIFSDEFEVDGRTFYPGDDPYWEGVDFHYWPTVDYEWYSPRAITTQGGNLVLTMSEIESHGLNFESGMLQSWNKFCFTRGYVEVSVALPGNNKVGGYWPGVWLMGNLGRPGYGATTEGTWPYSYDSCDVGTFPNQTYANGSGPTDALTTGNEWNGGALSYLPGQKLSSCTCKGEDHPGPNVGVGRGAPEIDILEAQVDLDRELGQMSQSAQFAPYDSSWQFDNTSSTIYDTSLTKYNGYLGGLYQQAVSGLVYVNTDKAYGGNFQSYGVEYWSDKDDPSAGYITWQVDDVASWKMNAAAVAPNAGTAVGQRLVSVEPMSIIFNFGMSDGFQAVNFANLKWPAEVRVDYIRVYQVEGEENIGCDPKDFPTADYIDAHLNAYSNANLTLWEDAGYSFPRNSILDGC